MIGWSGQADDRERMNAIACYEIIARAIAARARPMAEGAIAAHFDKSVKALLDCALFESFLKLP